MINLKNNKSKTKLKYNIQSKPKNVNVKSSNLKQQNQKQTNNTKTHFKGKGTIYKLPIVCDVETLRTLIRKKAARVVDVRRIEDYKKGHIPTAVSLPLANLLSNDSPEQIVKLLETLGIYDEMPVVVYDDTFGALAARVAWTFQYVGHENTSLLEMTYTN
ncbi:MAG TPA: rhodanese-like domain-containing protein, partial [Nitrososphaeraceae archaeon]